MSDLDYKVEYHRLLKRLNDVLKRNEWLDLHYKQAEELNKTLCGYNYALLQKNALLEEAATLFVLGRMPQAIEILNKAHQIIPQHRPEGARHA